METLGKELREFPKLGTKIVFDYMVTIFMALIENTMYLLGNIIIVSHPNIFGYTFLKPNVLMVMQSVFFKIVLIVAFV